MEIKLVQNKDFMQLAELTVKMYKSMDEDINEFQAINTLITLINTNPSFTVIGLYEDNIMLGFVTGYEGGNGVFYFSGIYLDVKNSEWTKKLIEYSFALVEDRGYIAWEVDATNKNISSIMEKYEATPMYTRYRKELTNG